MYKKIIICFCFIALNVLYTEDSKIEIEINITGDYPKGERIDPEIVVLNGKDVRENVFSMGKYELEIYHPGYERLLKEIVITPGSEEFLIEEVLITTKRKLEINITYDIPPSSDDINTYKVTLAPLNKLTEVVEVREGYLIKPNSYLLRIERSFYEIVEKKMNIWPDKRLFSIDEMMMAKMVKFDFDITFDVDPPKSSQPYKISVFPKKNTTIMPIESLVYMYRERKIYPGEYILDIVPFGYEVIPKQHFVIPPMDGVFIFHAKLIAKKSQIVFQASDPKTGILVAPLEVIDLATNTVYDLQSKHFPNTKMSLRLKFQEYMTQDIFVTVGLSEDVFLVSVPMVKLHPFQMTSSQQKVILDKVEYPYQFLVDDKEVEEHLISQVNQQKSYLHTVMLLPTVKKLRIVQGYIYRDVELDLTQTPFFVIQQTDFISIPNFINHLDTITKQENNIAALKSVEYLLMRPSYRVMLQKCPQQELDELCEVIGKWELEDEDGRLQKACQELRTFHEFKD